MIDPSDKKLSVRKQAKLLGINRNRLTTRQTKTTQEDSEIMKIMDRLYIESPFYGLKWSPFCCQYFVRFVDALCGSLGAGSFGLVS